MPISKFGREYSYLRCNNCSREFDADTIPAKCPFCGAPELQFSYILCKDRSGRILTLQENRARNREYLKKHLPGGLTADEIDRMSDRDVENLCDIMAE